MTEISRNIQAAQLPNQTVNVKDFGAVGDGVTDDTAAINAAIAALSADGALNLGDSTYRITSTINVTGGKHIIADNAILLKDFDGVGLAFTGGSNFNQVTGYLEVRATGSYVSNTAATSTSPTAHGITVTNNRLIVKGELSSTYHQGNGVLFTGTGPNSNRSMYKDLRARFNGVNGVRFSGTSDDTSVWQIDIYADGNREAGIISDTDFMGRNWSGYWYTEGNCIDTTSNGVDLGKLRFSNLEIYSEEQTGAGEIVLGANTDGLTIRSFRRNADIDNSTAGTNGWLYGDTAYNPGATGGARLGTAHKVRWDRARTNNAGEGTEIVLQDGSSVEMGKVTATYSATPPFPSTIGVEVDNSYIKVGDDTLVGRANNVDYFELVGGEFVVGSGDLITPTKIQTYGNQQILAGSGTPEGVISATRGSLYLRYDGGAGTCLYVKESGTGNTGWVGK